MTKGKKMLDSFTRQEKRILFLLSKGRTNAQIMETLFITRNTVKSHMSSIYSKLADVSDRTQAAIWGQLNGFGQTQPLGDLELSKREAE